MSYLARGHSAGRVIAADGALAITDDDGRGGMGTIIVSSTTGTKTATFSFNSPVPDGGGPRFQIYCSARSGGQYNVACTYAGAAGTLVIDAANEAPIFHRIGSTLYCVALGGSTHS